MAKLETKEKQRDSERIAALAASEILTDPSNIDAVLQNIVEIAERLLPATGGASIILWDSDQKHFYVSASSIVEQDNQQVARRVRRDGGATRWVIDHMRPCIVSDIRDDPFGANPMLTAHGLRSYAGFPIIAEGKAIGVIYTLDREPRHYSEEDQNFMRILSFRVASALTNARLFAELEMLSIQDELTGLYNRRGVLQRAERIFRRAHRFGEPLSILAIDVDNLKEVNDTHGHSAGDELLIETARRLQYVGRDVDVVGRMGGDEFIIVLVHTTAEQARAVAHRLIMHVRAAPVRVGDEMIHTSVSVGIAALSDSINELASLINIADAALYKAKRAGKDRIG
jgi:diguanylate cyclase (GGDEF)-like protein